VLMGRGCCVLGAGRDFYGPDGVYPFAGRECARALALQSTDTADCHDDLQGKRLGYTCTKTSTFLTGHPPLPVFDASTASYVARCDDMFVAHSPAVV
jgi:hypothetical protein